MIFFKTESNTATQENVQQNSICEEIEANIKGFFATENLNTKTEMYKLKFKSVKLDRNKIQTFCQLYREISFGTIISMF